MHIAVVVLVSALVATFVASKKDNLDFTSCVVHQDYIGIEKIRVKPTTKPKTKPKSKPKTKPKSPIAATNYFELGEDIAVKVRNAAEPSVLCYIFRYTERHRGRLVAV